MSSSEARQQRINEVVSTYQRSPGDTGSTEVQGMLSVWLQSPSLIAMEFVYSVRVPELLCSLPLEAAVQSIACIISK